MEEVKIFFEHFLEVEFDCYRKQSNIEISDEDYSLAEQKVYDFHLDIMPKSYSRGWKEKDKDSDKNLVEDLERSLSRTNKRLLFKISKLNNFKVGYVLAKYILKNTYLYRVDVSHYYKAYAEFSKYSRAYFIGKTSDGLKIVYYKIFISEDSAWAHSNNMQGYQVGDEGEIVDSLQIQVPIDKESLRHYNKN